MNRKQALLYVLHCYFNTAGTEEHTRLLASALSDTFDIYIAAPFKDRVILIKDGKVISEYSAAQIPWPMASESSLSHSAALQEILKRVRPCLIHVQHAMHWHLGLVDDLARFGVPVVMSFHDYFAITPHYTMQGIDDPRVTLGSNYASVYFGSDISQYLRMRREKFLASLQKLAVRISPSEYLKGVLEKVFPGHYTVIEHGIAPFAPTPAPTREAPIFGYIGCLLPQKGYKVLLDAFEQFQREYPQAVLYIYGDGDGADKRAVPSVIYKGHYGGADLSAMASSFDVGIIPSVFAETFCLTLSELWMAKKPVIASRIGALTDRVIEGRNGRLFTPGDTAQLAALLRWFYTESSWRMWELPVVKTADTMAADYRALYKKVLSA